MTKIVTPFAPILILTQHNQAIIEALAESGYLIIEARDRDSLIALYKEKQASLIILDEVETCVAVREPISAKIILISDDIDGALAAGADDCISFHPQLLQKRVASLHPQTDLRQAESSIRTSRQELQSILTALPDTIIVLNKDGKYLHVASEGQSQSIPEINDLVGKTIQETLPERIASSIHEMVTKALEGHDLQHIEYDLQHDKQSYTYHATASPLNDEEVVIAIRDISAQKRAEIDLIESEQKYRRLFDNAGDAIFVVDVMSGEIIQVNPQASWLLGYSQAELLSMTMKEIEIEKQTPADYKIQAISNTRKLTVESKYKRHDAREIDVEISSRVIQQSGKLTLISFVRDITERKRSLKEVEHQRNLAEALLDTANALNESSDLNAVLAKILANISRIIPCDSANIMIIKDDVASIIQHLGYESGGVEDEDISRIALPLTSAGNLRWVIQNKKTLRVDDTHHSPHFNWVDATTSNFVQSLVTAPIIINDKTIGFINLDSNKINNFIKDHEYQLMAFANQAAIAMQQAQLIEELRRNAEILENRVSERTQELSTTNSELQEAQAQLADERNLLRLIIDTIPDAIYVKDRESRFLIANKRTIRNIPGIDSEKDLIGKTDADLYPEVHERLSDQERKIIETGEAQLNRSEVYHNDNGTVAHLLVSKVPLRDSNGKVTGIIGVNHDLTQLRQAEARLEQVIKSARCLLWTADVRHDDSDNYEWDYRMVNEEAAKDFLPLASDSSTYTETWLSSICPDDQKRRDSAFKDHILSDEKNYTLDYAIKLDSKRVMWLHEDVIIAKINHNRWHVVGVCTDISSRKEAEIRLKNLNTDLEQGVAQRTLALTGANEELLEQVKEREKAEASERQQRIIAEVIRDSVAKLSSSLNRDEVFDYILSAISNIVPQVAANMMLIDDEQVVVVRAIGYSDNIIGLRYNLSDIPDFDDIVQAPRPRIIPDVLNYDYWHDEETNSWIRSHLSVPINLNNQVIGFINLDSATINSFTEEQAHWLMTFGDQAGIAIRNARYTSRLEERIEERTRDLEFERAQLNAILNGVTDGVVYTDMERKPFYINKALVELSGYSDEEWIDGRAQANMNIVEQEHLDNMWDRILGWLENNDVWHGETKFRRKDGSLFDAQMVRTTVKNQDGKASGIVTVLRDVSDEKQLEKQKARFITTAAHELRTPIANLKTRLYLIKRQPEKLTEHLGVAETVTNLMQNLVEYMFDLSQFERGVMEIKREKLHLQDFLNEVIQYQLPEADRQAIALTLHMPDEPIILYADPFRLSQVFINLIGNALRYADSHSEIRIIASQKESFAKIIVNDNGPGIEAEHMPNLFQPFYQAESDGQGAGLGLAIVYEIIKTHEGEITVDSEIGKGTTFQIRLPLNAPEAN